MWVLIIIYITSNGTAIAHKKYDTLNQCITEQNYIYEKYNQQLKTITCAWMPQ